MRKTILTFATFMLCSAPLMATDYYVSASSGSDTNSGTQAQPFKTIQKAASLAVAGDHVYIMEGVYREEVIPANSGTNGAPIVFEPFGQDQVIVTGTDIITGWQLHSGNIYKAPVTDEVLQVFADGYRQDVARYPDFLGDFYSTPGWAAATSSAGGNATFNNASFPVRPLGGGIRGDPCGNKMDTPYGEDIQFGRQFHFLFAGLRSVEKTECDTSLHRGRKNGRLQTFERIGQRQGMALAKRHLVLPAPKWNGHRGHKGRGAYPLLGL